MTKMTFMSVDGKNFLNRLLKHKKPIPLKLNIRNLQQIYCQIPSNNDPRFIFDLKSLYLTIVNCL